LTTFALVLLAECRRERIYISDAILFRIHKFALIVFQSLAIPSRLEHLRQKFRWEEQDCFGFCDDDVSWKHCGGTHTYGDVP
jgi:hypothetical protein